MTRVVDTRDTLDNKGRLHHGASGDTMLIKYIISQVLEGRVDAYYSSSFGQTKIYRTSVLWAIGDTMYYYNKASNYCQKIVVRGQRYPTKDDAQIHIIEQWSFDPIALKTEISILGIGICRLQLDSSGKLGGSKPIFWVKFAEMRALLQQYDKIGRRTSLQKYIWCDYFKYPGLIWDTLSTRFRQETTVTLGHNGIRSIIVADSQFVKGIYAQLDQTLLLVRYCIVTSERTNWHPTVIQALGFGINLNRRT